MFPDDTNLFFSYKMIKEQFHTLKLELIKLFEWFNTKKLSLNKDKSRNTLPCKVGEKYNIPLKLFHCS